MKIQLKIFVVLLPLLIACTGEAVLSRLTNTRASVILKASYESNDGYSWLSSIFKDDGIDVLNTANGTTGNNTSLTAAIDTNSRLLSILKLYIDIAELRISTGAGIGINDDPEDYYTYIAQDRQVMCNDISALFGKQLDTCRDTGGLQRFTDFFDNGFSYPATDVQGNIYQHLSIFFRRIVSFPSVQYNLAPSPDDSAQVETTTFDNRQLNGKNIENLYQLGPDDDARISSPALFPLQRTDLSIVIPGGEKPYVLEVRIFLKNLFMQHVIYAETNKTNSSEINRIASFAQVFYGPSDWKQNNIYDASNTAKAARLGGNILLTARVYQPYNVGSLTVTGGTSTPTVSPLKYFVVVKAGTIFKPFLILPLAATKEAPSATITNLAPGEYDLYRTCDNSKLVEVTTTITTGIDTSSQDGFPETVSTICNSTAPIRIFPGTNTSFAIDTNPGTSNDCVYSTTAICP